MITFAFALFTVPDGGGIDAYVRQQMSAWHIPGTAVAVIRRGKVMLAKGYGFANVESKTPVTPDTAFEVLSVGKEFTATAVMILVEAGKLSLQQPISTYLPTLPETWKPITIRQLLSHTSGIPDYTDAPGFFARAAIPASPDELLGEIKDRPLQFVPGTRFRYSNSNYYLLGRAIEAISGEPFDRLMTEHVFGPCGMTTTRMDDFRDIVPNRATGYHWLGADADRMPALVSGYHGHKNVLQNAVPVDPSRKWAAGGFITTLRDLIRWDANRLLKSPTVKEMRTEVLGSYGLGQELHMVRGHHVAGHQGGGLAFNATIARYVDDGVTVIVLCNQTSAPSEAIANHIAAMAIPSLAPEKSVKDPDPATGQVLKQVLVDAAQGKADPLRFSTSAADTVSFVQRMGPRFLGPFGALSSLEYLSSKSQGGIRTVRYRATYEKGILVWAFGLDAEGRIVSMEPEQ